MRGQGVVERSEEVGADRPEFGDFFNAHFPAVRRFAARRFGPNDADDIAQETMLRAFTHLDELAPGRSPLPWLRTVALRIGVDYQRRRCPAAIDDQELEERAAAAPDPYEAVTTRVDLNRMLRGAMCRMSRRDREALALLVVDGVGIEEMATLTGVTTNTVRQRLFRARRNLGRFYRELGGVEYAVPPTAHGVFRRAIQPARRLAHTVTTHGNRPPGRSLVAVAALVTTGAIGVVPPHGGANGVPSPPKAAPSSPRVLGLPVGELVALRHDGGASGPADVSIVLGGRDVGHVLSFTETWADGLADWRVSGATATTGCATRTDCALRLDPAGSVAVSRRVGMPVGASTVLTFDVRRVPGNTVRSALDVALDSDTLTLGTEVDDSGGRLTVRSATTGGEAAVALMPAADGRVRIAVAVDAVKRSFVVRQVSGDHAVLAATSLPTALLPLRLDALTFRAATPGDHVEIGEVRVRLSPCANAQDDDGDGFLDLDDPGCLGDPFTVAESPDAACSDGVDNDGDGDTDGSDPGCASKWSTTETPGCANGRDDDGDGLADYPEDPKCDSEGDLSEVAQCRDGVDQDADGAVDFPFDRGCGSAADDSEWTCTVVTVDQPYVDSVVNVHLAVRTAAGVCVDPDKEVGTFDVAPAGAPTADVRGYVEQYELAGPAGPVPIYCVSLDDGSTRPPPCAAVGATYVRLVAVLVRVSAERPPGAAPPSQARVCGAVVRTYRNGTVDAVPGGQILTLC